MAVINEDYAPAGLSFELVETTRTLNPRWFQPYSGSGTEMEMKTRLCPGSKYDPSHLHIYSVKYVLWSLRRVHPSTLR